MSDVALKPVPHGEPPRKCRDCFARTRLFLRGPPGALGALRVNHNEISGLRHSGARTSPQSNTSRWSSSLTMSAASPPCRRPFNSCSRPISAPPSRSSCWKAGTPPVRGASSAASAGHSIHAASRSTRSPPPTAA